LHDSSDSMPTSQFALFAKRAVDARRSVDPARFAMHGMDLLRDRFVFENTLTWLTPKPRVEPTARDLQDFAHLAYPEGLPVLLDEPEFHFWSSAK